MASPTILQPRDIDVTKIQFSVLKQSANGGRNINIKYDNNKLLLQTPEMRLPFGMNMWSGDNGAPPKFDMTMAFENDANKPILLELEKKIQEIDDHVISQIMKNSASWLNGKTYPTEEVVRALFTASAKPSKDGKYPPSFKTSLPFYEGKFVFDTHGKGRNDIDLMDVFTNSPAEVKESDGRTRRTPLSTKGARVQAILQLSGIWIVAGKFGLSWKVRQLKLAVMNNTLPKHAFVDMGNEGLNLDADGVEDITSTVSTKTEIKREMQYDDESDGDI